MLFSLTGEIGLIIIGALYVFDCWFNSFIDLLEITNNSNDEQKQKDLPDSLKHLYS